MDVVRVVSSLVAGAALALGPAAVAGASDLPTRGTSVSGTATVPVMSVVNSPGVGRERGQAAQAR